MGLFDGIIIVSDIDGTFLGKKSRIVPKNLESIRYFQENGGKFTIATGREFFIVYPSVPQVEEICNCPAIACNGAYIYDYHAHRKLIENFLDDAPLLPVIRRVAEECLRAGFRVDMLDCYFVERIYKEFEWVKGLYPDKARVMPLEEMPRGCWHKVAFDGPPDEIDRADALLRSLLDERFRCVRSGPDITEIQSAAATKGKMLSQVKALSGGKTLYAIGDYDNDYDMLVSADRCAVPANGLDRLKAIPGAILVCDHDEGAIAGLINHIEGELRS